MERKKMEYKDLGLLNIGNIYLRTVENILNELIKSGNLHIVDGKEDYDEITKRSDFNISIPTLFLLFHGIETTMKGLLINLGEDKITTDHNLINSIKKLEILFNNKDIKLIKILKKYIYKENMNQVLKNLLKKNNQADSNSFYKFLKYPFDKKDINMYSYLPIQYQQDKFLPFAKEIIIDIDIIMKESIKIYREK